MKKILFFLVAIFLLSVSVYAGINDALFVYYPFNGNAYDESGNVLNETVYGTDLTPDSSGDTNCAWVSPNYIPSIWPETLDVTIAGQNVNFIEPCFVTFSCPQIQVNSCSVVSPTQVSVNITIPETGTEYTCDITVTTTLGEVHCTSGFEVYVLMDCMIFTNSFPPEGGTIDPRNYFLQGCLGGCVDFTAIPNPGYSFSHWEGGAEGTENPTTVCASEGENPSVKAVFLQIPTTSTTTPITTTTIPKEECSASVISTIPPLNAGLLPHVRRIVINGENSNWNRTTAVSIEGIKIVIPLRIQPTRIIALIVIPSTLTDFTPGEKEVGVATGADLCTGTVYIP